MRDLIEGESKLVENYLGRKETPNRWSCFTFQTTDYDKTISCAFFKTIVKASGGVEATG